MESPPDLSKFIDLSCRISKRPPDMVKMIWPTDKPKKIEVVSMDESEMNENKNEPVSPIRKKKYQVSQRKSEKNYMTSEILKKSKTTKRDIFKFLLMQLRPKLKMNLSHLTDKIKRKRFISDFHNLKDYHYELIKDPCYFSPETKKSSPNKYLTNLFNMIRMKDSLAHLPFIAPIVNCFKVAGEKFKKTLNTNSFEINPNSPVKILWDLTLFLLTAIQLFLFSIEKCYSVNLEKPNFEKIFVVAFYFDLVVSMNTKMFREGVVITSRKIILKHLFSKKFVSVLVPCICLSFALFTENKALEYLKLALLIKLLKNNKLSQRLRDLIVRSRTADALYQLLVLILFIICWAHAIAVLWHFISMTTSSNTPDSTTWLKSKGIDQKSWEIKYIYSFYWGLTTMMTVGYGDITPTNINEMIYNIFAMFLGCCIFGYTMNKIGEILNYYQKNKNYLNNEMSKVTLLLQGKNIPYETQTKIKRYLEFVWKQEQKEDPEHENFIMNKLSSELKNEIYLHTNVRYLKQVPVLKNFSEKTLTLLAQHMKKVCFCPEEVVFKAGDYENLNIFFILDGNLKLVSAKDDKIITVWRSLKKNDYFGEREIFTGKSRSLGVQSVDFSTLFKLSRTDIIKVLKKSPSEYEKFCEIKDLDILYDMHHQYEIPCFSCGFKDHALDKCAFLNYVPNQKVIIHKHLSRLRSEAKNFRRRKKYYHHALQDKPSISFAQTEFYSLYEDDDEVRELVDHYTSDQYRTFTQNKEGASSRVYEKEKSDFYETTYSKAFTGRQKSRDPTLTKDRRKSFRNRKQTFEHQEENFIKRSRVFSDEASKDKELEDSVNISHCKENTEDAKLFKTMKSKKKTIHDLNENSQEISPRNPLGGYQNKQNELRQEGVFSSKDLIAEDPEGKRTIYSSNDETKTYHVAKEPHKDSKTGQQSYFLAFMDSVKVFKDYFIHNNITEINKKKVK